MDNHITRVYVLPEYQKKRLWHIYYEKLGFSTIKHERYPVENGVILAYEVIEKELHKTTTDIISQQ